MFFKRFLLLLALQLLMLPAYVLNGQTTLHQLIVASGCAFSNPNDFVSLAAYNPITQATTNFGEIKTQAVQAVCINEDVLYVTATDSIVAYNLDTYQRIAAVAVQGVRYMLVSGEMLVVSIQYPATENFIRIFNKNSLQYLGSISQISDEAAGMVLYDGKIYVAVPGSWMSTVGKLAVLNAVDGSFIEEIELGSNGEGIHDLFVNNGKVLSVNRSPWGSTSGTISVFDPVSKTVDHHTFPYHIGKGFAINEQSLYVFMNDAVGVINLVDWTVTHAALLPDPGSSSFIYYADAVLDGLNGRIYATVTDYFSMGEGYIYDLEGSLKGNFAAGISAEALALDYRQPSFNTEITIATVSVSPNPASSSLFIGLKTEMARGRYNIYSSSGKVLQSGDFNSAINKSLDVSALSAGCYVLALFSEDGTVLRSTFIKQ